MSSLWTPYGEQPVEPDRPDQPGAGAPGGPGGAAPPPGYGGGGGGEDEELDPEEMREMLARLAATTIFLVLLAAGIIAANVFFPKKEFSLPRVAVDATLAPDGSMHVVEHITYDFPGQFHYGTRPIPVGAYTISDVHVSEHGQELVFLGG